MKQQQKNGKINKKAYEEDIMKKNNRVYESKTANV